MIKIKRGMNIPIQGAPQQLIEDAPAPRAVGLVGYDYVGLKPTMEVREGERVKLGQLLFTDKKTEGVRYTAPASGVISAINRGAKRVLQSVVIDIEGDEAVQFPAFNAEAAAAFLREAAQLAAQQPGHEQVRLYPPVPPPVSRVANVERVQMLVESGSRAALQRLLVLWLPQLQVLRSTHKAVLRWAVDVDPLTI